MQNFKRQTCLQTTHLSLMLTSSINIIMISLLVIGIRLIYCDQFKIRKDGQNFLALSAAFHVFFNEHLSKHEEKSCQSFFFVSQTSFVLTPDNAILGLMASYFCSTQFSCFLAVTFKESDLERRFRAVFAFAMPRMSL